jgi:UDP-3-O-[3-hydroxymyristoyl] glucosamine N-acyltransferase
MNFSAQEILAHFSFETKGNPETSIDNIGSLRKRNERSLLWAKTPAFLSEVTSGVIVCAKEQFDQIDTKESVCYLITEHSPRLMFAKVLSHFVKSNPDDDFINDIERHRKNVNLRIGENVFIARDVEIGDGTHIHHNVVIHANTKIGKNCKIQSTSTIGTEGLGLQFDETTGKYFKFPQIGGVVLHDEVEIGPNTTIRRSALDDTVIKSGTKIGAMCNVGHNCIIGENCILTCNVITSGSSVLGNNVYMGVSSTIRQGINIGSNAIVGQGAVVVKHIPDDETWVGNPAARIKSNG